MSNYLALRSSAAPTFTVSTLLAKSISIQSTTISLGQSTNQTYNNFSNGSYAPVSWVTAKSALSGTNKTVMSANGLYQMIVANATSGLFLSSDSGITWTTLTGGLPTLTGSAYWSDGAISANGQYITLSIYGGSLWMSADYGRTFALTNQPTPDIWLPLNGNTTDSMGSSTVTTPGTVPGYVTLNYPGYTAQAVNLLNTAGSTAMRYVRGTWTGATNFTVSGWFNPQTLTSVYQTIFSVYAGAFKVAIANNNTLYLQIPSGGAFGTSVIGSTSVVTVNTWYYVTGIFQTNGLCSFYVNNTLIGSATNVGGYGTFTTSQFSIGTNDDSTTQAFNGYIDDLKITNSVSAYVPIPLLQPNIWIPFENNTADLGSNAITPTVTGAVSYVPGIVGLNAVNLVNTAGGTANNFIRGTVTQQGVYTISGWFNMQSYPANTQIATVVSLGGNLAGSVHIYYLNNISGNTGLSMQAYTSTPAVITIGTTSNISLNTWYHIHAIYQQSGTCSFHVNGILIGSIAGQTLHSTPTGFGIGTYSQFVSTADAFNGYIDDFRLYSVAIPYHFLVPQNYRSLALSGTGQYALAATAAGWVVGSSDTSRTWEKEAVTVGTQGDTIQPNKTGLAQNTWEQNGVNWVVSASTTLSGGYDAYRAFNNDYGTRWVVTSITYSTAGNSSGQTTAIQTIGTVTGDWLQIQSPVPLVMVSYQFANGFVPTTMSRLPRTFYIVGSNDGATWFPIQSGTGATSPSTSSYTLINNTILVNSTSTQTFGLSTLSTIAYLTSTNAYIYFRLVCLSNYTSGADVIDIGEWIVNFARPPASLLSLNHTGQYQLVATGPAAGSVMPNQTGLVASTWSQGGVNWVASESSNNGSIQSVSRAFNNTLSSDAWLSNNTTQRYTNGATNGNAALTNIQTIGSTAGEWIQIQSSVPVVLSSFAFGIGLNPYPNTGTPKTYYIVGSNDGSTWVPLQFGNFTISAFTGASVFINMNTTGTQTLTSTMVGSVATTAYSFTTNAYTYFRLIGTSLMVYGGSSGTTYMEVGEWYLNFRNSVSYSTNFGSTWLNTSPTVSNESVALSASGQYALSTNSVAPFARLTLDNTNVDAQGVLAAATGAGTVTYSTSIKAVGSHSAFFNQTAGAVPTIYLNYTVPAVLNRPPMLTMAYWVYPTTLSGNSTPIILNSGPSSGTYANEFYIGPTGQVNIFWSTTVNSAGSLLSSSAYISANTWSHLALTFLSGIITVYVNGISVATVNAGGLLCAVGGGNMTNLIIGAAGNGGGAWAGFIDDVRLYTSALSADEINGLFKNPALTQTVAVSSSYLPITSYTEPALPGITANIVDTAVSQTGQYMVAVTSSTTNNVYYSTDYGATFTALTIGTTAMVSCSISYDGSYLTVANATTAFTLNRNTRGFTLAVGNQAGQINQAQNAIAIGDKAGRTNQSANSIVLNATGNALDAVAPGFFVAPVASAGSSVAGSFAVLGYGADSQVVQSSSLFIGANGNVGFGTTAPTTALHVVGSGRIGSAANYVDISANSVSGTVQILAPIAAFNSYNGGYPLDINPVVRNSISAYFATRDGAVSRGCAIDFQDVNTHSDYPTAVRGGQIVFFTAAIVNQGVNASVRMIIDPNGYLYLSSYTNGTLSTTSNNGLVSSSSDRRIKENIVYLTDTRTALSHVNNLKPATFKFKDGEGMQLGFIAQDVEQFIPLAVDGKKYEWQWETDENGKPKPNENGELVYKLDENGEKIIRPRGLTDRAIIATQTLAIQELAKQNTELTQKLDSLLAWAQTQGYTG